MVLYHVPFYFWHARFITQCSIKNVKVTNRCNFIVNENLYLFTIVNTELFQDTLQLRTCTLLTIVNTKLFQNTLQQTF